MNDQPASREAPRLYAKTEDETSVVLQLRRHRNYGQRFFTMFETASTDLAGMDRPPCYFRTLFWLMGNLDPVQWRKISAREIAAGSSQSVSSAERALAMLQADKVIFARNRASALARRLNNRLCWKANSEKWHEVTPDPEVIDARGR